MANGDPNILDLIKKYESGGRNVRNYLYSETSNPPRTAQGVYQITNENWRNYGPKVGIDLKKYPNAMAAPEEEQRKVASHILTNAPGGLSNWLASKNPKFQAELKGIKSQNLMADAANQIDPSKLPNSELLKILRQKYPDQKFELPPDKPSDKPKGPGKVEAPPKTPPQKGIIQRFAEQGDPESTFAPSQGFGFMPGLRKVTRGVTGYGEPPGRKWQGRTADVLRGLGDISVPVGATAAALSTGGAALGAEGLMEAVPAMGRALWPYIYRGALGAGGSKVLGTAAKSAAPEISKDPQTQELIETGGETAGALAGGFSPEIARTPVGRAAIGYGIGHLTGIPHMGEIIAGEEALGLRGMLKDYVRSKAQGGGGQGAKPTGNVGKAPEAKAPTRAESTEGLRLNTINDQEFLEHEAARGSDPKTAQQHLATAKAKIAEKAAEKVKQQQPVAQAPVTLQPDPSTLSSSGTPQQNLNIGGTSVNVPPGTRATPNLGNVNVPQHPTGMPQTPQPPPTPGSFGTVNAPTQMPPRPQGPIIQGTGMPQAPVQSQPPIPSPGFNPLETPVRPLGPPLGGKPVPTMTPTGAMPPTDFERAAIKIADAAMKFEKLPPRSAENVSAFSRWQKELGFKPTRDQLAEGRRIYRERIRSRNP